MEARPVRSLTAGEPSEPEFVSVSRAARRYDLSEKTIYRLLHAGDLVAVKIGSRWRIAAADLDTFMQNSDHQ